MSEGGRSLNPDRWLLTGIVCCCISAGISLAAILTAVSWIISQAGS